jgi:hypothetical protein
MAVVMKVSKQITKLNLLLLSGLLVSGFPCFSATLATLETAPNAGAPHLSPGLDEILKLVDAKVDPEVIKAYIHNSGIPYAPSASEIILLKDRGVPEGVLAALLERGGELRNQAAIPSLATPVPAPGPVPTEAPAEMPAPTATAPTDYGVPAYSYAYPSYAYSYPYYGYPYYSSYWYAGWPYYWPYYWGFYCSFCGHSHCSGFHNGHFYGHYSHVAHFSNGAHGNNFAAGHANNFAGTHGNNFAGTHANNFAAASHGNFSAGAHSVAPSHAAGFNGGMSSFAGRGPAMQSGAHFGGFAASPAMHGGGWGGGGGGGAFHGGGSSGGFHGGGGGGGHGGGGHR